MKSNLASPRQLSPRPHSNRTILQLLPAPHLLCAFVFLVTVTLARADVRLPALFADNMVLQQGMRVPVWGWAEEGEEVKVTFRGQTISARAKNGKWMVKLASLKAGGPVVLVIEGKNTLELHTV